MSQTIKFKTPTGHIEEMVVGEVLAVDGSPVVTDAEFSDSAEEIIKLKGRMEALEERLDRLVVSAYEPELLNET